MKRFLIILSLLFCSFNGFGQHCRTINVEKLSKPKALLETTSYRNILKDMIGTDSSADGFTIPEKVGYNIIAQSDIKYPMVDGGYHPFFWGMYNAYANHRPFTLSPDMIWLLICRGFSQHINNNSEQLRHLFVNFNGKIALVVRDNRIRLDDPKSPWPEVFPQFARQIDSNVKNGGLGKVMTADFSTTTETSMIASQITLMDAMKSYFEFVVIRVACGIPTVTLEGTKQDWKKVLYKTEALRKYKLDWWVDQVEPVLKKIIDASAGKTDVAFWRGMFKVHRVNSCGNPGTIDGWMVKFFPYDRKGHRNNLDSLKINADLPDEMTKVDLKYIEVDPQTGRPRTTPLMLWAGFVGLKQNNATFGLTPEIGWMIRKKGNGDHDKILAELKTENDANEPYADPYSDGIRLRVKTIPDEILEIPHIKKLVIDFTGSIEIPDEMAKIKIDTFEMTGTIDKEGIARICKLFPSTRIVINGTGYVDGKPVPSL